MNLFEYKDLIDGKPMHIATVNKDNNPNLAVASNVKVIEDDKIVISVNEMVHTQENIQYNHNVVLTVFNEKYEGLRIFGVAQFYTDGEYFSICEKTFFGNGEVSPFGATKPKGAIVVKVKKIAKYVWLTMNKEKNEYGIIYR